MKSLKVGLIALSLGTFGFINTSLASEQTKVKVFSESMIYQAIYDCPEYQQLATDKKTSVDKTLQNLKANMQQIQEQLQIKQEVLDKAFTAKPINEAEINARVKEMSTLHNRLFADHIQARLEMAKVGLDAKLCWESMAGKMMKKHRMETEKPKTAHDVPAPIATTKAPDIKTTAPIEKDTAK